MSDSSPSPQPPKCPNQPIGFQFATLITLFPLLLSLIACSGISAPDRQGPPPADLTVSTAVPSATAGSSYDATLSVSGGTAPYLFSLASGQLPAGVLLSTTGTLSGTPSTPGNFTFAVSVTDSTELSAQQSLQITVSSPGAKNSFSNLQRSDSWIGYGQQAPDYVDCSPSPCNGISFSLTQGIRSPSMSGSSTQYNLGGTHVYSDALFVNHLIGVYSSQGMPDNNHVLVPTLHDFTYDVYFYGTDLELSQALEFDVNQFFNDIGFIWGHQCVFGSHQWDIWDNVNARWVHTGVACHPISNQWNHLTIQVQRTSNNQLLYQSITLNGVTSTLNQYYDPGVAVNWYGVTINYQMDGNYTQSPYSIYLDELAFTYK